MLKYWQKVRVKSWFYEGMVGILKKEFKTWLPNLLYLVQMDDFQSWELIELYDCNLEIIK